MINENEKYLQFCLKTVRADEFLAWETSHVSWKPLNLILQLQGQPNKGSEPSISIVLLNIHQLPMHFIPVKPLSPRVAFGVSNLQVHF